MPDSADAPGWVRPALVGDLADGRVCALVLWPDPCLRQRCEPAGYLSGPALRRLAADLLATMYAAGGRGLAAPQIGVARRIFVMDAGWKQGIPAPLVVADPEILVRSPSTEIGTESCLSIPGRPVEMSRPVSIGLSWYDLDGSHRLEQLDGAAGRIAQHEADHLDGCLIVAD